MKKLFTTVTVVVLAVGGHRARTAIDFRPLSLSVPLGGAEVPMW
jgi:hypothetical protein